MNRIVFSTIVLSTVTIFAAPAGAAELRGLTRDAETGKPVDFVAVQVIGTNVSGAKISRGIMSLANGRYFLAGIPLGEYTVRFTRVGYRTVEDTLSVTLDIEYQLDVRMKVQPIELEKVVVTGDRYVDIKDTQTGFINLDVEALANLPAVLEADPIRSLTLLPGVQSASDYSSGLYVRGGGPDQTLILLDQITIYNPTHAFGLFSAFNADALQEVNLYKGAYPAQHGGRLGSVLEVTSRDGQNEKLSGRAGLSTIASRLALDGPLKGGGTWMVSGRRTHLEPFLNAIRTDTNPVPDYFFYDLNGRMVIPAWGGKVSFTGYQGRDHLHFDLSADSFLDMRWGNSLIGVGYKRRLGSSFLGEIQASASRYRSESEVSVFSTPVSIENEIKDYSLRGNLIWRPIPEHKFTSGFLVSRYQVRYLSAFNRETGVDYWQGPYEVSVFLEDQWRAPTGVVLQTGLRARYITDGNRFYLEPRLSISRPIRDRFRLKVGAGIYHQYLQLVATEGLSATDFYVPIDETAEPGRSWQVVAGLDFAPALDYAASIEAYYNGLDNLVQFNNRTAADDTGVQAIDIFHTGGTGYSTGAEFFLRKTKGTITGWAGYALGWTRRTFEQLNQGESFPPKYDRRHDVSLVGQYRRGKWLFASSVVYSTGQAYTPASARYAIRNPITGTFPDNTQLLPASRNSGRLLPYNRLDVSMSRDFSLFGLDADWQLQAFNLYNRRNEWFVQYDTSGEIVEVEVVRMLPIIPSLGINVRW